MSPPRAEGGRRYRVVIYCPDRHIVYDGRTPDEIGVGGGITARVRMARALARRPTMAPGPAGSDPHALVAWVNEVGGKALPRFSPNLSLQRDLPAPKRLWQAGQAVRGQNANCW